MACGYLTLTHRVLSVSIAIAMLAVRPLLAGRTVVMATVVTVPVVIVGGRPLVRWRTLVSSISQRAQFGHQLFFLINVVVSRLLFSTVGWVLASVVTSAAVRGVVVIVVVAVVADVWQDLVAGPVGLLRNTSSVVARPSAAVG